METQPSEAIIHNRPQIDDEKSILQTCPDIEGRDVLTKEDIIRATVRANYYRKRRWYGLDNE